MLCPVASGQATVRSRSHRRILRLRTLLHNFTRCRRLILFARSEDRLGRSKFTGGYPAIIVGCQVHGCRAMSTI